MSTSQWYYAKNDQQMGPVSSARLRELAAGGELRPDDLVWRDGLDSWSPAAKVQGLFPGGGEIDAPPVASPPIDTASDETHTDLDAALEPLRPDAAEPPPAQFFEGNSNPPGKAAPRIPTSGGNESIARLQLGAWGLVVLVSVCGGFHIAWVWLFGSDVAERHAAAVFALASVGIAVALAVAVGQVTQRIWPTDEPRDRPSRLDD